MKKREVKNEQMETKEDKVSIVRKALREKNQKVLNTRMKVSFITLLVLALILTVFFVKSSKKVEMSGVAISQELKRAIQYEQFEEGDEDIDLTNNVKFSAFFLRDLNGDGYAEKIKGTCKEVGSEDTLYMELNVFSEGYLKDAKIKIDGQNFYLQTSLPKDEEISQNYVGSNTKEISFNKISNGTQKLLTGKVRSGDYTYTSGILDALNQNVNNYSRDDNKIVLTGIYVSEDGSETEIVKEIDLIVDWYGEVKAEICFETNKFGDLSNRINEDNQTIDLEVDLSSREINNDLILTKNRFEGTIPSLNGYMPTEVQLTTSYGTLEYNTETGKFVIERTCEIDEDGYATLMNNNGQYHKYNLAIRYPLNAYTDSGANNISLEIPVTAYYEGANNTNEEFVNPYKSNVASYTYKVSFYDSVKETAFNIEAGEYKGNPISDHVISKQKAISVYNGISEGNEKDYFKVTWTALIGADVSGDTGIIMRETKPGETAGYDEFIKADNSTVSAEDFINFVGISVTNADATLGNDGWIKIYDDETGNVLVTLTKNEWNKYNTYNYYMYETPVKHIRVETSAVKAENNLYIRHLKEIEDLSIAERFSIDEFNNFSKIKCSLKGYYGDDLKTQREEVVLYKESIAIANIRMLNNTLSTQSTTSNVIIEIDAQKSTNNDTTGWIDGEYLIKLPNEIMVVEINEVIVDNKDIEIVATEIIENDNGRFIKILTNNISGNAAGYKINIDTNITPDPRVDTSTKIVELYAYNNDGVKYYYESKDIYDVNNNLNVDEKVNKTTTNVKLVSPNSLLTNQVASEYDDNSSISISPQEIDITPLYAKDDNVKRTVKIDVQLKNNYSSSVSDVVILGKIPFEGNTTVLSKNDLKSQYTTTMVDGGIEVPESLKGKVIVYYSANEDPDKNLTNPDNGWIISRDVTNWDEIKTFLIVFENYNIASKEECVFTYKVKMPDELLFNKIAYSHHGVYFSLNTDEGKYRTQVEANKLGFRIAEKYDVEILKTQIGKDKVVPGATYSLCDLSLGTIKTGTTDEDGKVVIKNIYAERIYELSELKSPENYSLNTKKVLFTTHVDENGIITVETIENEQNAKFEMLNEDGQYTLYINTEDEPKGNLEINKIDSITKTALSGVRIKLAAVDGTYTKILTTDSEGKIIFTNIEPGKEYRLEEIKSKDYYLADTIRFKILNIDNVYTIEILSGEIEEQYLEEVEEAPYGHITIGGEKMPTYNLEVSKIEKISDVVSLSEGENSPIVENETKYLAGAKFRLYKDENVIGTYFTDDSGKFTIENLYQYVDGKNENAEYVLKELIAPEGYAKAKDIKFKAQLVDGKLEVINLSGNECKYTSTDNVVNLFVENSPAFKLIKKDAETGELLSGVKFAIYNIEDGMQPAKNGKGEILGKLENINGKEYYVLETDSNGSITADLPEGYYKAIEVQTYDKYVLDRTEHYFGVGLSKEGDNKKVDVEWAKTLYSQAGNNSFSLYAGSIEPFGHAITANNEILISSEYYGDSLKLDDEVILKREEDSYSYAASVKLDLDGKFKSVSSVLQSGDFKIISSNATKDGGHIITGYTYYDGEVDLGNDVILNIDGNKGVGFIIKYDSMDQVDFAKIIPESEIISVKEMDDGSLIALGSAEADGKQLIEGDIYVTPVDGSDTLIIKYNSEGEIQWANTCGLEKNNVTLGGIVTKNGDILVISGVFVMAIDGYETELIRYNSDGEFLGKFEFPYKVINVEATDDGGFYIISATDGSNVPEGVVSMSEDAIVPLIMKYNSDFELERIDDILAAGLIVPTAIDETSDGGYAIAGFAANGMAILGEDIMIANFSGEEFYEASSLFVAKYDVEGNCQWADSYATDGLSIPLEITEYAEGKYILTSEFAGSKIHLGDEEYLYNSNRDSYGNERNCTVIMNFVEKDKEKANIKKAKQFGGKLSDLTGLMEPTFDNGYIMTSTIGSDEVELDDNTVVGNVVGDGNSDALIIKYDENDNIQWYKQFGTPKDESISSITELPNGDILFGIQHYAENSDNNGVKELEIVEDVYVSLGNQQEIIMVLLSSSGEIKKINVISGSGYEYLNNIINCNDGYITLISSDSEYLNLGNDTIINKDNMQSYFVVKYNYNGDVLWSREYKNVDLYGITEIENGFVVLGHVYNNELDFGNGIITPKTEDNTIFIVKFNDNGEAEKIEYLDQVTKNYDFCTMEKSSDGGFYVLDGNIFAKYNSDLEKVWINNIEGFVIGTSLTETMDGGVLLIGGYTQMGAILGKNAIVLNEYVTDYLLRNEIPDEIPEDVEELIASNVDGLIVKYNSNGICQWTQNTDELGQEIYIDAIERKDGNIVLNGLFTQKKLKLENGTVLENKSEEVDESDGSRNPNGMIIELERLTSIPEEQEIVVENERKTFKIKTSAPENSRYDGNVTSQYYEYHEIVKYGDNSKEEIVIEPDYDFEIAEIKINGVTHDFEPDEDGNYVMPLFENVTEDKLIEVVFVETENKFTINKVDSQTKDGLKNVKFNIEQLDERFDNLKPFDELFDSNVETPIIVENSEAVITPTLTATGEYYFVESTDGLIPTNSRIYQKTLGQTTGVLNSTASSYIPINLEDLNGKYIITLDAKVSSATNADYGFATITETTDVPDYSDTEGRFVMMAGTVSKETFKTEILEGGKTYYLHLGYNKKASYESGDDLIEFSNFKIIEVSDIETYNFEEVDGKFESTNDGVAYSTSNSYLKIDLSNISGGHYLNVNAEISSEKGKDYGYAILTKDPTPPSRHDYNNRMLYISGEQGAREYSKYVSGGNVYYLHFGYVKNGSVDSGKDKFTINNVELELGSRTLYNGEHITNDKGQIITDLPYGKYEITEINALEGYVLNSEPITITFNENTENEIIIENDRIPNLIVHHYEALLNEDGTYAYTTNKVAEDDVLTGNIGDRYNTSARLDLAKYEPIQNAEGNYIFPDNMNGVLVSGEQEVTYYYTEKPIKLTVNHYIEGTRKNVLLKDGTEAKPVVLEGLEGEIYTTEALSPELLHDKYELLEVPHNASGTYSYEEASINYYYRVKSFKVTTEVVKNQEKNENGEIVEVIGGEITTEIENVKYGETSTKDIIITPYDTFEVSKVTVNGTDINFVENDDGTVLVDKVNNVTENKVIRVTFVRKEGQVVVHHYLIGTHNYVPGKENGELVDDQLIKGPIGSVYYTSESVEIHNDYMFAYCSDNASGVITEEIQEVYYYYKAKDYAYRIEFYLDGVLDEKLTDNRSAELGTEITTYIEQKIDGCTFDKVENLPLVISKDEETNVIKAYYNVRKDLSYKVEYYFDGVLDESLTDTFENQTYGTIIDTVENKCIDGYSQTHSNLPYTISIGENVIKVYYTENIGSYTVKYLEEGTNIALKDPKVVMDLDVGATIVETAPEIVGYEAVNTEATIELGDHYNEIIFYYRKDVVKYTVEYLDKNTNDPIYAAKEVYGYMINDVIMETSLDIPGYVVDGEGILEFTIKETETKVAFYYVPRSDLTYTIEYYYNDVLDMSKTETIINQTYLSEINTYIDKLEEGYVLDKVETLPLLIGLNENVIKVYYISNNLEYRVEYYYENVLDEEKTEYYTAKYKDQINTYEEKIETGYCLDRVENLPLEVGVDSENNVVKVYYAAQFVDYTINYYYDGQLDEAAKEVLTDIVGTEITSYPEKDDDLYVIDKVENLPLILTDKSETNVINVYYETPDAQLKVKYVDKLTGEEIDVEEIIDGKISKKYNLEEAIKDIDGYALVEKPEEMEVEFTEEVKEYVFYYIEEAVVYVSYLEKDDNEDNSDNIVLKEVIIEGYIGKEYETMQEDFEYYVFEESTANTKGTMTKEPIEVVYYYSQVESGVCEKHIDVITGETIDFETHEYLIGEEYKIEPKEFDGYDLVEDMLPENAEGIVEEDTIEVKYYYIRKASVRVEYIDSVTNELLSDAEIINGHEEDDYEVTEKEFENYIIDKEKYPENTIGIMEVIKDKDGNIIIETVVRFYYVSKANVIERHIDITTEEILKETTLEGFEGKDYEILAFEFEGYDVVKDRLPENSKGKMTKETIEVNYYYIRKVRVVVEFIDSETGKNIIEKVEYDDNNDGIVDRTEEYGTTKVIDGHVGDNYETKPNEFRKYKLVDNKLPENASGTMNITKDEDGNIVNEINVKYYYIRKIEVVEKHIDIKTGKEIENEVVHEGNEGDHYNIQNKEYDGYDLVVEKVPSNSEGTMEKDVIEVKYYYIRKTKVVVEYVDKETGKVVKETVEIDGHEGDEYATHEENVDGYVLVKEEYPANATGTMDVVVHEDGSAETITYVRYYYMKVGQTENPEEPEKPEKPQKPEVPQEPEVPSEPSEPITPTEPEKPVEPETPKEPEKEETPVVKTGKVIVRYLERGTNKVLAEEVVKEGKVGDDYTTEAKRIELYTLEKEPDNKNGKIVEGEIVVTYYYYYSNPPVTVKPSEDEKVEQKEDLATDALPETGEKIIIIPIIAVLVVIITNIVFLVKNKFFKKENK